MSETRQPIRWTDEDLQKLLADTKDDFVIPAENLDEGKYIGSIEYLQDRQKLIEQQDKDIGFWVSVVIATIGAITWIVGWIW